MQFRKGKEALSVAILSMAPKVQPLRQAVCRAVCAFVRVRARSLIRLARPFVDRKRRFEKLANAQH